MSWLQRLFARRRMDGELDKEIQFHVESQVADKVRAGIPEIEARRLTRLEFGGSDQIKEDCRESRGTMWLESLVQDVRFGLRQLPEIARLHAYRRPLTDAGHWREHRHLHVVECSSAAPPAGAEAE